MTNNVAVMFLAASLSGCVTTQYVVDPCPASATAEIPKLDKDPAPDNWEIDKQHLDWLTVSVQPYIDNLRFRVEETKSWCDKRKTK